MVSVNTLVLGGNLTRDPELRYLQSGQAVAEFGLAINRNWTAANGEKREETCFVDVTAWGKLAERVCQYLKKGRSVLVEGRLQFDTWQAQDGTKRSKHRVVADSVHFLGPKPAATAAPDQDAPVDPTPEAARDAIASEEVPF